MTLENIDPIYLLLLFKIIEIVEDSLEDLIDCNSAVCFWIMNSFDIISSALLIKSFLNVNIYKYMNVYIMFLMGI